MRVMSALPGDPMDTCPITRSFLTLIAVTAAGLIGSNPTAAQQIPGGEEAGSVQIIIRPALESVGEKSVIVRWMSTTPAGPAEHFGVVHYGTDPKDLSQTAKSPHRLNTAHPNTTFRVRVDGLKPGTTYYYTVELYAPRRDQRRGERHGRPVHDALEIGNAQN